jgi:hypothetical protein
MGDTLWSWDPISADISKTEQNKDSGREHEFVMKTTAFAVLGTDRIRIKLGQ